MMNQDLTRKRLNTRFKKCWKEFRKLYKEKGFIIQIGKLSPEWARICDKFWTEADIVHVLTNICAEEFNKDGSVHNEAPVDHMFFENCEKSERYYVDIDIIDPDSYKNGEELRQKPHDIFAEIKFISKGMWRRDIKKRIDKEGLIPKDCQKLKRQIEKGRCKLGYVCIIDDEPDEVKKVSNGKSLHDLAKKWEKKFNPVKVLIC